jgi:hypothetical protein
LEKIAPLLHSRTNRLVEAAAATECFERTDMVTTCNQAKKADSAAEAEIQ